MAVFHLRSTINLIIKLVISLIQLRLNNLPFGIFAVINC